MLPTWFVRHKDIIRYLAARFKPVPVEELASEVNISERVLREDIHSINKSIGTGIFQIEHKDRCFELVFFPGMNLDHIFRRYFELSMEHSMLEHIFFNEGISVDELADYFHTSTSTTYRRIHAIDSILSLDFDLHFSTNPCCLEGEEERIRHFYAQYMSEKYKRVSWPFESIDEGTLTEIVIFVMETFNEPLDFAVVRNIKILMSVSIMRLNQNHSVAPFDYDKDKVSYLLEELKRDGEMYRKLDGMLKRSLDEVVLSDIFYGYAQKNVHFTYSGLLSASFASEEVNRSYLNFSHLVEQLSIEFSIPVHNREHIIMNLHNTAHFEKFEIYAESVFFKSVNPILEVAEAHMPHFYSAAKEGLAHVLSELSYDVKRDFVNHLLYTLIIHWKGLPQFYLRKQGQIKALLISNLDIYHARISKELLDIEFGSQLDIEVCNGAITSLDQLGEYDAQVVIANFPMDPIENKIVVSINTVPNRYDIKQLREAISAYSVFSRWKSREEYRLIEKNSVGSQL
ncbi:M protein trans-acting positive regulator PRD domain-containing protein [Salinicoccus sp. ID82-1]|uniref:M protein trans-acting positive regulator PRD domain-containing protein n=1 Tax=Salinicoccus sp. ID82-1 TaxID=2820269 RepID=UPI001F3912F1